MRTARVGVVGVAWLVVVAAGGCTASDGQGGGGGGVSPDAGPGDGGGVAAESGGAASNGGAVNAGGASSGGAAPDAGGAGGAPSAAGGTTGSGGIAGSGGTTGTGGATGSGGVAPGSGGAGGASSTVGEYDPFELSFTYPTASLSNPWEQVTVTATVTSPSGKTLTFDGFYYDVDTYEVRFAPAELGAYQYTVTLNGPSGTKSSSGFFTSVASSNRGFLRRHPGNPYRLIFEKGTIGNAIGFNDCWSGVANGALGGFIEAGQRVDLDTYLSTYGDGGGGFNVLRWNPANCSFDVVGAIAAAGNTYLVPEGKRGDELLGTAHAHGFHVMYTFFHLQEWGSAILDPARESAVQKAIRYSMARYGAYADVWELTNESDATTVPDAWQKKFADFVRAQDPYRRIVTSSWERPSDWAYLDARSPHMTIYNDAMVDEQSYTKSFTTGVPVIAGEMYNTGSQNWDAGSAHRMRTYAWTAFMSGLVDVYWNTTFHKSTGSSATPNLYIGAQERGYVAQLQKIAATVDPDVVVSTASTSVSGVTARALRSSKMLLVYAYRGSGTGTVGITVDVPVDGTATWYDPATGTVLGQTTTQSGTRTLTSPSFPEDVALRVE